MFFRRLSKYIVNTFYFVVLKFCSFIFRITTKRRLYWYARCLGLLLFVSARKHRKTAISGLSSALNGSLSSGQVKRLARDSFNSMAKSAAEMAFFVRKPDMIRESVRIEGAEHLREGLSRGKGVVLVSAHFGNFPLMLGRLCLEGYRTSVIMRPLKDERITRMFIPEAERVGVTPIYSIPRAACVQQALKTLRRNESLFIPVDQNFGTGGVYVDFFGRKAATATGPVVFAERTGAAIIPCFIIRHADDTHTIRIEPILEIERNGGKADIVATVQRITVIIERYIRQYPQEWTWIHRRWKSRPKSDRAAARGGDPAFS